MTSGGSRCLHCGARSAAPRNTVSLEYDVSGIWWPKLDRLNVGGQNYVHLKSRTPENLAA